jgi:hypothetical protein
MKILTLTSYRSVKKTESVFKLVMNTYTHTYKTRNFNFMLVSQFLLKTLRVVLLRDGQEGRKRNNTEVKEG